MKCIVLTDINGLPSQETCFLSGLGGSISVERVGLGELLGVPLRGEELYHHLILGGFDAAAAKVLERFGDAEIGLGYSSGGAVLWKSVLRGLRLNRLVCISSTRLRDEDPHAMPIPALTVFGDQDASRPTPSWGEGSRLERLLLPGAEHAFYVERDANWLTCHEVLLSFLRPCDIEA
ncbi:alpha/beta hydrolase [Microvirga sp. KLBC 81]|uniref:alpha/beta hydrolase n=1 Tax=Microvirga sp. KLBC 81 TaxID=1862707 RepID=UPI000D509FAA|nr:alpha/beta hydrolase [Microvirga sp. KLBC 81]PVE23821.1 alpha/beta hydrolase [Microvirga sp. KLBC 81]